MKYAMEFTASGVVTEAETEETETQEEKEES